MESQLHKHDLEFNRLLRVKQKEAAKKQLQEAQGLQMQLAFISKDAYRQQREQEAKARAKEMARERAVAQALKKERLRAVQQRGEDIIEQRRQELHLRNISDAERIEHWHRMKADERQRQKEAALEKEKYCKEVYDKNETLRRQREGRIRQEIEARVQDQVKVRKLEDLRERKRKENAEKAARNDVVKRMREEQYQDLCARQFIKDYERAVIDEEIRQMKEFVKMDRLDLQQAIDRVQNQQG
jgi:hypothetical protein